MEIHATLRGAYLLPFYAGKRTAVGHIFGDTRGRFEDGATVRTSTILRGPDENGVIQTEHSNYKLELADNKPFDKSVSLDR